MTSSLQQEKELGLCHKLRFSNTYVFETKCFRPIRFFKLWILLEQISKYEIWMVDTIRMQRLENLSLLQRLNSCKAAQYL